MVLCDGISCAGFVWRYLQPWLETRYRVLHIHYRGHGRSGLPRDPRATTLPHAASDINGVMDALNMRQALWLGHSMGVQVCLEAALRYPDRLRASVLLCGSHGRVLETFKDTDIGMRVLPLLREMTEHFRPAVANLMRLLMPTRLSYTIALLSEINGRRIQKQDFMPYLNHFATMPPDLFMSTLTDAAERSSEHFLARLSQPFLVLGAERDGFTPPHVGNTLAKKLPAARFELLEDGSHIAPIELPELVRQHIEDFIDDHPSDRNCGDELKPHETPGERFRAHSSPTHEAPGSV